METGKEKASGQEAGKRDSFREWEAKLDDRMSSYLDSLSKPSESLSFHTVDSVTLVRQFRLSDAVAKQIINNNCREMDRIRKILRRRCANCNHVVSSDSEKSFEVAFFGPVCSVCHDIHVSLTFNPRMKNMNYFKEAHEKWVKDKNDDGSRGGWRDRAGM